MIVFSEIKRCQHPHSTQFLQKAKEVDAILVGAVGGPKWDAMKIKGDPVDQDGLMCLRKNSMAFGTVKNEDISLVPCH